MFLRKIFKKPTQSIHPPAGLITDITDLDVREDGRCRVCDESSDCAGGCWVMREHNMHCVRDYVWDVDK